MQKNILLSLIFFISIHSLIPAQNLNLKDYGFCNDTIGIFNDSLYIGNKKIFINRFPVNPYCDTIVDNYFIFKVPCGTECLELIIYNAANEKYYNFFSVFAINYKTKKLLVRSTSSPQYLLLYNFDGKLIQKIKFLRQPVACAFCYVKSLTLNKHTVIITYSDKSIMPIKKQTNKLIININN